MEFQERRNVVNLCVKLRSSHLLWKPGWLRNSVSVSTESHVSVVYLKVTTKAVARSHVRDCDSGTVRNFLEDDRHGVGRVGPSIQVFIYITCLRKGKKILEEKGISLKHKLNPSLSFQAYGKVLDIKVLEIQAIIDFDSLSHIVIVKLFTGIFREETIGETTRSMTL
ncbi:hypothetical protein IGI04_006409 [Brassica rapa subsp. trilocularis]|uniref:Uncharacterized protein n=1 Tax=Brassica rapa subsp. trilocularis TaxID=1813537 RepID=A0ABQ7NGT1_BRACM|nr:hypothetical protein IGI04_006409 [Brassica rapa subsp. trilocularis]